MHQSSEKMENGYDTPMAAPTILISGCDTLEQARHLPSAMSIRKN
jgi:hypothetical protein